MSLTKTFGRLSKEIGMLLFGVSRKEEEIYKRRRRKHNHYNKLQYLQAQLEHNDLKKIKK